MISELRCTGFRSLDGFELAIKPGLNVLVGPNGGGKTNILALISFISELSTNDLSDAINTSGGASKVFRRTGNGQFTKNLEIMVKGQLPYTKQYYVAADYDRHLLNSGFVGLKYEWKFEIDASRGYDDTFFRNQTLRVLVLTNSLIQPREDEWHYEIHYNSADGDAYDVRDRIINTEMCEILRHAKSVEKWDSFSADERIKSSDRYNITHAPIYYAMDWMPVVRWVGYDLRSGTTFNFDPAVCKAQNDSAHPPVLGANGSGLAATLNAIHRAATETRQPGYFWSTRGRFPKNINKRLLEYFSLINYTVSGFKARNDPISNKITIYITIDGSAQSVEFPIEFASDGTVKWLAFLTALLTETSGFSLEEPENFLHPDIQRQAVELIRTETEGRENLCVLMTTHSETLLNATRPDEIVIVSMEGGVTSSKRVDDPDTIDEEIHNTGFGLGYFYISGALYD